MTAPEDIAHHYDVSNDFYRLWLDERMIYSCAYFPNGHETIEQAQEAKLAHICKKLGLKKGETLLDVGCGWGALILYAVEKYGVIAHGITLSRNQYAYAQEQIARARASDRCRVSYLHYKDLPASEKYDKIVSVGMFEHVGKGKLPHYFQKMREGLSPHGIFLNHGITHNLKPDGPRPSAASRFMDKYIFPGGALEDIGSIIQLLDAEGFEIHDVEQLRPHYAKTLAHWLKRFESHLPIIVPMVGEGLARAWRLYLAGSQIAFEMGGLSVYQILVSPRQITGKSSVPLTRADII